MKTNGIELSLFHDNRDFKLNPSRGSALRLKFTRDFGWFDSSDSWTVVDAEFDKYFSLGESDWFRQWLQFVPFAEIGRVAPAWNVEDLHEDMKWSVGLGVRFWAKGLVARIDSAASEEGFSVQMMVAQPFQF